MDRVDQGPSRNVVGKQQFFFSRTLAHTIKVFKVVFAIAWKKNFHKKEKGNGNNCTQYYYYYFLIFFFLFIIIHYPFSSTFSTRTSFLGVASHNGSGFTSCLSIYLLTTQQICRMAHFACRYVDTENTWSNSSNVLPFVSGTNNNIKKNPIKFQPAYQLKAPVGLNAFKSDGHVMANTKLKNHVVAVASDMPYARTYSGYASAE